MGRELKRKEAKKNKKQNNNKDIELNTNISMITLLKLVSFIVIFLLVIYYLLAVFVTKEIDISNKKDNETEDSVNNDTTVSDKILATNIFNQKEDSYYVYFYDFNSDSEDDLTDIISKATSKKIYKVDTGSALNSKYVTKEKGNPNASNLDDLKVISNTLIEIENDKFIKYYEGKSDIMKGIKG